MKDERVARDALNAVEQPKQNSKFVYIVALLLLVVICGVVAGYTWHNKKMKALEIQKIESQRNELVFHDLGEMIVNLDSTDKGKAPRFLKVGVKLQVRGIENLDAVKKWSSKITDDIYIYLRQLRASDLQGALALYKLKEEIVIRINATLYPARVEDVLFGQILVQ